MKRAAILLLCISFLTACAAPKPMSATATAVATQSATHAPEATATPSPTEAPTATATITATATETIGVSPEAKAAWDKLNLQSKDQWQVQKIEGWGMGFVNKETGEEIVDNPITFSNGQGQTTVVHQLCYKTQTEGKGLMTVLTCMSQPRAEHRLVKISGTDADAQKFFQWAIQDQAFITGNPQLLAALQAAAKGEKPLILVQGELAGVPPEFIQSSSLLTAEGMPFGANAVNDNINRISVLPFARGGKSFAVMFMDYEKGLIDYWVNKGQTSKAAPDVIRMILEWVGRLTSDGSFMIFLNPSDNHMLNLVHQIPIQLTQDGISVNLQAIK
jgi:hypothetical protein